jgi:hypothetical protein
MSSVKQKLFTNWHMVRLFRLAIGIMMLVAGIQNKDWMMGLVSAFFLYQALTDSGCCGTKACYATKTRKTAGSVGPASDETIEYEEVK